MAFELSPSRGLKRSDEFSVNLRFQGEEAALIEDERIRLNIKRSDLLWLCLKEYFDRKE
jgi:hypothetical protein